MAIAPARPLTRPERPPAPALPPAPARGRGLPLPVLAAVLALLTVLSRLPFRSRYLFSWDSANFALALEQYNVAFHQPQPPGYPLYVGAARALLPLLGEANASYVALSIGASGLAVFCLTLCAAKLGGRTVALLAAFLLATSSVFWSQGEVAYPYAFLALFSSLVGWLPLVAREGGRGSTAVVVLTGGVIGVGAGFRSELLPFLLPLWLYGAWGLESAATKERSGGASAAGGAPRGARPWALAGGGLLLALAVLAWYVPMVLLSGGWSAYQQATGSYYAYFIQTTSGAGKLLLGVLENTRGVVGFLYNGLGLALLPALYALGRTFSPPQIVRDWRSRFLLLWLLPPLAFYVLVHIGNPGYVLSFLPPLCIYSAMATFVFFEDLREAVTLLGAGRLWPAALSRSLSSPAWVAPAATATLLAVGAVNGGLFLFASGEGRLREIRQIDRTLERQIAEVQRRYPPASSVIFAYDRSRQFRYYLPRHKIELLFDVAVAGAVTDTSRYWERRQVYRVPPGVDAVLFPDLDRNSSDTPGLVQAVDLGEGVSLYVARVQTGDEVRYGYQYASVGRRE
jgi:Protein of unknown function (DUF2723)